MKTYIQKIEKWRIKELALVLFKMAGLLKSGDNREWANVFLHFHQESEQIINSTRLDLNQLKSLLRNIQNCFFGASSLMNIELCHEKLKVKEQINQELLKTRNRLFKILGEMEEKAIEYIS